MRLLVIGVAVAMAAVPTPESWVESLYSQKLYLAAQNVVTPLTNRFHVAVFDGMLVVVIVGVPVWWALTLRRAGRGRRLRVVGGLVASTLALTAALYLVFLAGWGLNYRRQPLTAKLDFSAERLSQAALLAATSQSVRELNALHAEAHAVPWPRLEELPRAMGLAFERAQTALRAPRSAVSGVPKPTILTPYFRVAGIDGMVSPFSLEVLINTSVLPFERPFVVAHEWAHLAGYADEAEASFVGWLTCMEGDASTRYSGWLSLFPYLMRHLDREQQASIWEQMEEGPLADLRAVAGRVSTVVPVVQRNANRVYDGYLRANRVERGIESYGVVVDLILGTKLGNRATSARAVDLGP